jgi:hypothetical protein
MKLLPVLVSGATASASSMVPPLASKVHQFQLTLTYKIIPNAELQKLTFTGPLSACTLEILIVIFLLKELHYMVCKWSPIA